MEWSVECGVECGVEWSGVEWSGVESVSLSVESVESVESVSESVSGETRTDRGGNLTEGSDLRRERRPMMEDRATMYLSDFSRQSTLSHVGECEA